jgi:acyl-CoA oxidase
MSEAIGGYLSENRIDALKNDTEIYTTFEGDNTVLMQSLKSFIRIRKSFGKMDAMGIINYV